MLCCLSSNNINQNKTATNKNTDNSLSDNIHKSYTDNSMTEKLIRAHLFISGKVQGVYFRQNTLQVAVKLGVVGWVRNLADGRVEAVIEGEQSLVKKVVTWCQKGTPPAIVNNVEVDYQNFTGSFNEFKIIS